MRRWVITEKTAPSTSMLYGASHLSNTTHDSWYVWNFDTGGDNFAFIKIMQPNGA